MNDIAARAGSLHVSERSVAIAHLARRGGTDMNERLAQSLGVPLPEGPHVVQVGSIRVLGMAPGRWLALREPLDHDFAADLAALLKPAAAVCDQSDAYRVLRLRGAAVRGVLAKLIGIDLHERKFLVGQAASTVAAHVGIIVWRLEDGPEVAFELAVPRSYALSFREALAEAAAEFGVSVPV